MVKQKVRKIKVCRGLEKSTLLGPPVKKKLFLSLGFFNLFLIYIIQCRTSAPGAFLSSSVSPYPHHNHVNVRQDKNLENKREDLYRVITCISKSMFVSFFCKYPSPSSSMLMVMFAILCTDSSRRRKTLLIYCPDCYRLLSTEQTLNKTPLKTLVYQQTLPWFISSKAKFIKPDV